MKHQARNVTGARRSIVAAVLVLGSALSLTASLAQPAGVSQQARDGAPADTAVVEDEKLAEVGEATTERVCTECHGIDDIFVARRTVRGWQLIMIDMVGRGVVATPEEQKLVRRYLTRYFGRVPVNTATAEDLTAVLGLSPRQAAAVVEYRKANGKFADLDALAKVPGIDKAALELEADALVFE